MRLAFILANKATVPKVAHGIHMSEVALRRQPQTIHIQVTDLTSISHNLASLLASSPLSAMQPTEGASGFRRARAASTGVWLLGLSSKTVGRGAKSHTGEIAGTGVVSRAGEITEPQMNCETSAERAPRRAVAQPLPASSDKIHRTTCVCACSCVTRIDGRRKRTNTEHARGPGSNANK